MRGPSVALAFTVILTSCGGVTRYLPKGPVLSEQERDTYTVVASGADYRSGPRVPFPLLPVQVWGAHYDLDLVLESTHERYDMHEYARVQTEDGPVWLAKDALAATRSQSLVADLPDLHAWVPELPISRKISPVRVEDQSTADQLQLRLSYENLEGEPVVVEYEGKPPTTQRRRRNGNTMGHSADVAMAVLNIPFRDLARRASVSIDGVDYRIRRLAGLVKIQAALVQTQGGFAVSRFTQMATEEEVLTRVPTAVGDLDLRWVEVDRGEAVELRQEGTFRTLVYTFLRSGEALELSQMDVYQYGIVPPIVTVAISPALPDMRRRFEGRYTSRFAVDLDDQRGHARGRLEAFWSGNEAEVLLLPEAPAWVADRPMRARIRFPRAGREPHELAAGRAVSEARSAEDAAAHDSGGEWTGHHVAEVEIVRVPIRD